MQLPPAGLLAGGIFLTCTQLLRMGGLLYCTADMKAKKSISKTCSRGHKFRGQGSLPQLLAGEIKKVTMNIYERGIRRWVHVPGAE